MLLLHFTNEVGVRLSKSLPLLSIPLSNPEVSFLRRSVFRFGALVALVIFLAAVYLLWVRPNQLRWGATPAEIARPMPEDGIVAHPAFDATRAITIRARPEEIWPWLVQIGYGRAGFYGYDLIENPGGGTGIRSAQKILPEFQSPRPGDVLPLSVAATLIYGSIEPNRYLVWLGAEQPPKGVFIWELVPVGEADTRLISRVRWRYLHTPGAFALGVFTEFADHVAIRAILRGVRDRAEGRTPQSLFAQGCEIASWFLAFFELVLGGVWVLYWRRLRTAWLLAAGAGLLLQLLLYAGLPVWLSAPLPCLYLILMLRYRRIESCFRRSLNEDSLTRRRESAAAS